MTPELRALAWQVLGKDVPESMLSWTCLKEHPQSATVWRIAGPGGAVVLKQHRHPRAFAQELRAYRDWLPRLELRRAAGLASLADDMSPETCVNAGERRPNHDGPASPGATTGADKPVDITIDVPTLLACDVAARALVLTVAPGDRLSLETSSAPVAPGGSPSLETSSAPGSGLPRETSSAPGDRLSRETSSAPGTRLSLETSSAPGTRLSLETSPALAHAAAGRFARVLHDLPVADDDPMPLIDAVSARLAEWHARARDLLTPAERAALARLASRRDAFAGVRRVPCHRDFTPDNWLLAGTRLHVIDFEHARLDAAEADLVKLRADTWATAPVLADAFLAGHGPLDADAAARLDVLLALHAVATLAWAERHADAAFRALGRQALAVALASG